MNSTSLLWTNVCECSYAQHIKLESWSQNKQPLQESFDVSTGRKQRILTIIVSNFERLKNCVRDVAEAEWIDNCAMTSPIRKVS